MWSSGYDRMPLSTPSEELSSYEREDVLGLLDDVANLLGVHEPACDEVLDYIQIPAGANFIWEGMCRNTVYRLNRCLARPEYIGQQCCKNCAIDNEELFLNCTTHCKLVEDIIHYLRKCEAEEDGR